MCGKTWAKWLSVIALIMSALTVLGTAVYDSAVNSNEMMVLLIAITVVILSFSNESKPLIKKKY